MSKDKNRATDDELGELHNELARVLTDAIKDGVEVLDKEGEVHKLPASATILNVARQFLKDNGIDSVPTSTNPLGGLASELPQFDEEGHSPTTPLN